MNINYGTNYSSLMLSRQAGFYVNYLNYQIKNFIITLSVVNLMTSGLSAKVVKHRFFCFVAVSAPTELWTCCFGTLNSFLCRRGGKEKRKIPAVSNLGVKFYDSLLSDEKSLKSRQRSMLTEHFLLQFKLLYAPLRDEKKAHKSVQHNFPFSILSK